MIARHTLQALREHAGARARGETSMIDLSSLALLKGKKALVTGIANDQSIAWGCAKAFHAFGADLAITYLNDKSKNYVEPLAKEVKAPIFMQMDLQKPGELEAVFEAHRQEVGQARHRACIPSPLHRRRICRDVSSTARRKASCWRWRCRAGRSSAWQSSPSR